jgi:hypothetical protein
MEQVRRWLGLYFLFITVGLGAYIIFFKETVFLPISAEDARCSFCIIIPTAMAQLAAVFRWVSNPPQGDEEIANIPRWAVVGPPAAVATVLVSVIVLLMVDGGRSIDGGSLFRDTVTFSVSILSASTVLIVSRVFQSSRS